VRFEYDPEKAAANFKVLRNHLSEAEQPVTGTVLREVLRQEMAAYLRGLSARPTTRKRPGA
jgi:hypothetical protein